MGETIRMARCARCGATFVKIRSSVCENCTDEEDEDYRRISDTLAENSDQNVEAVAGLAGVTTACVLRMLDRGLIANEQVADDVRCGRCGAPAISPAKRLCQSCLIKLDQKFFSEINEAKLVREKREIEKSVHDTIDSKRRKITKPEKR